jgi:hypothetical protein
VFLSFGRAWGEHNNGVLYKSFPGYLLAEVRLLRLKSLILHSGQLMNRPILSICTGIFPYRPNQGISTIVLLLDQIKYFHIAATRQ